LLRERFLLEKRANRIPLRICVTGTRGKTSVTRLIAASLRKAGFKVLAKTTGSKPVIILPDSKERAIERRGSPSILEGKKILKIAEKFQVKALVTELMSIQPECGFVESVQILRPHVLVITNVRLDHLAQMGSTKIEVARSLAASIPSRCTVFIPQEDCFPVFFESGEKLNSRIVPVTKNFYREFLQSADKLFPYEFEENMRLTIAVSEFLGIKKELALQGMKQAQLDFGSLKAWKAEIGLPPRRVHLISIFAANDPLSTQKALSKIRESIPFKRKKIIGLLNLRKDRGDRTFQWEKALKEEHFPLFQKLFLIGGHAQALMRRLKFADKKKISVVKEKSPQKIMARLLAQEEEEVFLVGMGNMGGTGQELVKYWERIGQPYDF